MKRYGLIVISIILLDQVLKYLFPYKVKNYGASFSILENSPSLLIAIAVLALVIFSYLFFKSKEDKLALSLLFAGTFSNLIDRLIYGYIIDYLPLPYLFTFNLADLSNTMGVVILIIKILKK